MDAAQAEIERIARLYLRHARATSYRALRAQQDPPWASIAFGALGVATALGRTARDRRRPRDRAIARRWLSAAARASNAPNAFSSRAPGEPPIDGEPDVRASIHFGPDGVPFVRLLLAAEERGGAAAGRALRAFVDRCRARRGGASELALGVGGTLTALLLVHRATGAPRALDVAGELADDLLARATDGDGWARHPVLGFAHGRAGTLHALLAWAAAAKRELPPSLFDALDRLAADVRSSGTMGAPRASDPLAARVLAGSWCNGAAGLALLWARAYEHTRSRAHLRLAREAARFVLTRTRGVPADLCCGLGGRAYALLAMDRVEPGRGWQERARAMASRAMETMARESSPWPNGLYKGYPGLVMLARDVSRPAAARIGFPLVEGA